MRRLEVTVVFVGAFVLMLLGGCMREPRATAATEQAHVLHENGAETALVSLTPEAEERLGIETVPVTRQSVVQTRAYVGRIVALSGPTVVRSAAATDVAASAAAPTEAAWAVRLDVDQREIEGLDLEREATVLPDGVAVRAGGVFIAGATSSVTFVPSGASAALSPGQRVQLQVPVRGGERTRAVVPFSALLYDVAGDAWVYTTVEPGTFRRASVQVAFIDGDDAMLDEAPPDGQRVVSVGAIELFGAEFGVGH